MKCNILQNELELNPNQIYNKHEVQTAMLQMGFKSFFHLDYNSLELQKTEHGKPYISNYPHIHFNLTNTIWKHHKTKDNNFYYTAIAFTDLPVGIDVEHPRALSTSLPKKFLSEEEMISFAESGSPKDFLLEHWTLKEAYSKYTGLGITSNFASLTFLKDKHGNYYLKDHNELHFYQYHLSNQLMLSICTPIEASIHFSSLTIK